MNRDIFSYNLAKDEAVHLQKVINLDPKTKIEVSACTVAGSKDGKDLRPNEDAFSIVPKTKDLLWGVVFDGNSNIKPIKGLKNITGARYASHLLSLLFPQLVRQNTDPKSIMSAMNSVLLASALKFAGTDVNDTHTLPATACTIFKMDFQKKLFTISHIGDTFCFLLLKNDETKLLTSDLVKPFDEAMFVAIKKIAQKKNISPKKAAKEEEIRQMIIRRYSEYDNRPDGTGYGELNGQASALAYIQTQSIRLDQVRAVFFGSDGAVPPGWNIEENRDRIKLFDLVSKKGLHGLIELKKSREDSDPDFRRYIRYKYSDDATAIYINLMCDR